MTKAKVRKFNIFAFVVLPIIIIVIAVVIVICCYKTLTAPTVDLDAVTSKTQAAELWEVLPVVEDEYAYIIYCVNNQYDLGEDDNELIAFQGSSIDELRDTIWGCDYGAEGTSYWEGEGKQFDFTQTCDFEENLENMKHATYYKEDPNPDDIIDDFSNVTLYDVSEYKGYEHGYNNGIAMVVAFWWIAIASVTGIVLLIELVIAIVLKCTVFRMKKE